MKDHSQFSAIVFQYIKDNPDAIGIVYQSIQAGLLSKIDELKEHCSKVESIAAIALSRRYGKGTSDKALVNMLNEIKGNSFVEWSHIIEKLNEGK